MENDQNVVYRFNKINTQIKLIVLWISLIILYTYTDIFYSLFTIIKYSPVTEKIYRIKSLVVFIPNIRRIIYIVITIIGLMPVLIIIANIFIKKVLINYLNIITGFIYVMIGVLILLCYNHISLCGIILCIVEILILILIMIKSIQRLKQNRYKIENNQKIVFKFSEINTRIKLIVLWVSLIILYNCNLGFDSFLELIRFSPIAEKISHNLYLKEQALLNQLIMDHFYGKELGGIKYLVVQILGFLSRPQNTYFVAEMMIKLIPALIIISNIFITKNIIIYINIITGFIYAIIGILISFYYNQFNDYLIYNIMSIIEIPILFLILIKSIQWLKIKYATTSPNE
jgi:hypothetical protein